jgi:hypothetical protein
MNTNSVTADLLVECNARGISLLLADDGGLTIDAPTRETLTPDLLDRLKADKANLLTMLRPAPESAPDLPAPTSEALSKPAKVICRCGSTTSRDVLIHDGQSVRRDCGRCGKFIEFPVWYGKGTGHNGQHPI